MTRGQHGDFVNTPRIFNWSRIGEKRPLTLDFGFDAILLSEILSGWLIVVAAHAVTGRVSVARHQINSIRDLLCEAGAGQA